MFWDFYIVWILLDYNSELKNSSLLIGYWLKYFAYAIEMLFAIIGKAGLAVYFVVIRSETVSNIMFVQLQCGKPKLPTKTGIPIL